MNNTHLGVSFSLIVLSFLPLTAYSSSPQGDSIPIGLALNVCPIAIANYADPNEQVSFVRGYRDGYKFALTKGEMPKNYHTSLDEEKTSYARGYRLGRSQGFEDIRKGSPRCSLSEFGYKPVSELKGLLRRGFERSEFTTPGGETYWVEFSEYSKKNLRDGEANVMGYLSPEGVYGHMGSYRRELVIISIDRNQK